MVKIVGRDYSRPLFIKAQQKAQHTRHKAQHQRAIFYSKQRQGKQLNHCAAMDSGNRLQKAMATKNRDKVIGKDEVSSSNLDSSSNEKPCAATVTGLLLFFKQGRKIGFSVHLASNPAKVYHDIQRPVAGSSIPGRFFYALWELFFGLILADKIIEAVKGLHGFRLR